MFNLILETGLGKRIVSKFVTKWINEKFDCDAKTKFNDVSIATTKDENVARIHLDLDSTLNKNKLLQFLDEKV